MSQEIGQSGGRVDDCSVGGGWRVEGGGWRVEESYLAIVAREERTHSGERKRPAAASQEAKSSEVLASTMVIGISTWIVVVENCL